MSPKEASYGMGDPYTVYPTGQDFSIPPEMRDSRTIDMGGVAEVLGSILATRNAANLKPLDERVFIDLLRTEQQDVLQRYPNVAVLNWNFITRQNNVWRGLVSPTARLIMAKVAEGKYGAKTWMPVPSGKLDVKKDIGPTTKAFSEVFDATADREGEEELRKGGRTLRCVAFEDNTTGFLVCSGYAPTDQYDGQPIQVDSREYTGVMVPTVPALVSMMRKSPDQFTNGVILSLFQTADYMAKCQSEEMSSGRTKIDLM